jgi:signal transduction histidine kinase
VLDLWLIVVAAVFIAELAFSGLLPTVRFSVGFYAGRVFSLITSSIVLIILLAETTWLYVHLARSNDVLRRERHEKFASMEAMAALIAHEVSQPLGSILINIETIQSMLQSSTPDISEIREIAADINRDDVRASEVLRRIRTLIKKMPFEVNPIDLNENVRQAVALLSGQAAARQVDVRTAIGFPLLPISGDRVQIQQALVNVIVNAMDAMSEYPASDRRLTIQTALCDESAEVAIADTGLGIPPDKLQGVFEPFVTTKKHGMGMGLSIAQTVIEAHNGTISAHNQAKGGALFRIRLPLRKS